MEPGKRKIYFFLEKPIGFSCLKIASLHSQLDIIAVTTTKNVSYELSQFCTTGGIRLMVEDRPNNSEFLAEIYKQKPEIAFAISYSKLFKRDTINAFPKGIVNLHPALLPRNRGCFPTMWSIINGDKYTGCTLHSIDVGIDTGPIFVQAQVPISDEDTGETLYAKQVEAGKKLFEDYWQEILNGRLLATVQEGQGCYHTKELPFGGYIPLDRDSVFINRVVRAFKNSLYPGILVKVGSINIDVHNVELVDHIILDNIGEVIEKDGEIFARCSDGVIRIYPRSA